MNSPRPEESIVDAALAKPRAERAAFIAAACGEDSQLRELVEALLRAHDHAVRANPHRRPSAAQPKGAIRVSPSPAENIGDRIGHYKLLQQVGEGGCGVVYMAEQEEPVRRRVALKVIKLGMDTKQVIARFEAERQALAMMDHPNIAKVLDAGATETGRPYFVMELVRGIKITEYCDQNNLPTEQRLDLFIQVCRAIQHAHQKGIIHRDIKPSNVLVTLHDGVPVPKVIDFGIAKAIDQRLTDKTLFTALEQFVGTPAYMSPEQSEMSGLDIDTRSDIYSLGVLLYELLTGKVPFEPKDLAAAGLDEMRRMIRERDPVRPSTRISTLDAAEQTTIARRRQVEAPKLIHIVRGDLDWIVMKCLEKDRARRYETTNGLAGDIERFLADDPITARPPSKLYRFQKLVRRNKIAVAAAGAVTAALIIGLGLSTWLYFKERKALARAAEAERIAKTKADDQRAVLNFFLENVMAAARPEGKAGGLGHEVTVRKAIEAAEPKISLQFTNRPLVEAQIRDALGSTFMYLSDYSNAIRQAEQAVALVDSNMPSGDLQKLPYLNNLAIDYYGAGQTTNAIVLYEKIYAQRKARLGPDHPLTLASMDGVAAAYQDAGRIAESLALLEQAAKVYRAKPGIDDDQMLRCLQDLARGYRAAGQYKESLDLFRELLEKAQTQFGAESPNTFSYMDDLAISYYLAGMIQKAIAQFENILRLCKEKMGPAHAETIGAMNNLASVYKDFGRLNEAIPLYEEGLKLAKSNFGLDHPMTLKFLNNLAGTYSMTSRHAESLELWQETLKLERTKLGPTHPETISTLNNLAIACGHLDRFPEAVEYAEEAVKAAKAQLGLVHPITLSCVHTLANTYAAVGRQTEALALREEVLNATVGKLGGDHPQTLLARHNLAESYKSCGRDADAIRLLEENVQASQRKLGPTHPDTLNSEGILAGNYMDAARFADAERLFRELLPAQRARPAVDNAPVNATLALYAECLLRQDKMAEARPLATECFDNVKANDLTPMLPMAQSLMGWILLHEKKYDEAEPLLISGYEGQKQRPGRPPAGHKALLSTTGENLVTLYAAQGKAEKAGEWRAKLADSSTNQSAPASTTGRPKSP